jgi:tetratricopeptide (TPR) repeat protein
LKKIGYERLKDLQGKIELISRGAKPKQIREGLFDVISELHEMCDELYAGIPDNGIDSERNKTVDLCMNLIYSNLRDQVSKSDELSLIMAMGNTYETLGVWSEALNWYRTAVALSEELRDSRVKAESLYLIGLLRVKEGKWDEAVQCFDLCHEIGEKKLHDDRYVGLACNGKGVVFTELGEIDRAAKSLDEALSIAEKLDDSNMIAEICHNKGNLHLQQEELDKAMALFLDNLVRHERARDVGGVARVCYSLGVVYNKISQCETAVEYLERSMDAALELGDLYLLAKNYRLKGELYATTNDLTISLAYYRKALKELTNLGDERGILECSVSIGSVLLQRGEPDKAFQYFHQGLMMAKRIGDNKCASEINMELENLKRSLVKNTVTAPPVIEDGVSIRSYHTK